jgi:hypothetical protein
MGEYERKNKEEIHKELQDLDPMGSPHREEKVIGRNIDLDLLSLFPQRYARIMGRIERWASFPRSTMEGDRGEKQPHSSLKKGRAIYTPPGIVAIGVLQGRIFLSKFGPDNPAPSKFC